MRDKLTYFGTPSLLGGLNLREIGMAFLSDGKEGSFPALPSDRKPVGHVPSSWHQVQTFIVEDICVKAVESRLNLAKDWDEGIKHWRLASVGEGINGNPEINLPLYSELSDFTRARLDLLLHFLLDWVEPQYEHE